MGIIVNKICFWKDKKGVTERPRSLNPGKAIAMAICPIIVHFSTWRARSMHGVACEFARAVVRSNDAQKELARTSLRLVFTSDGVIVGVAIRRVERYDLVKIKPTESEAEH